MEKDTWTSILDKTCDFKFKKGLSSFINPYSLLVLQDFPEIAENIDYWHVDGISLVKRINFHYNFGIQRFSFDETSLAPIVFKFARQNNLKIAIIGTKKDTIQKAVANIKKKHSVEIVYYRDGYFSADNEMDLCIDNIIKDQIDIVICGMGTPYQEEFLIKLKKKGWDGYGYTCGGYLHQTAQKENYYPAIFDKLNIRWIYRIFDEPKLLKRYLIQYPQFFVLFNKFRNDVNKRYEKSLY